MKKIIVVILTILYLGSSSGATVNFHYCLGRLSDWSINEVKESKTCSGCGMKSGKKGKCCKEESRQYKIDKTTRLQAQLFSFSDQVAQVPRPAVELPSAALTSMSFPVYFSNAPPEVRSERLFLINQNFRI